MCPCTRATVAELERLLARGGPHLDAHVVFIAPDETNTAWHEADLINKARQIPGLAVHVDAGRRETELFQVRTSGDCLFYDGGGRLGFQGGLTASRGHEGENKGTRAILSLVRGEQAQQEKTPVFGCSLFEAEPSGI